MMLANIDENIQLDSQFIYPLLLNSVASSTNPKLMFAKKRQNTLQKKAESLDHSIKTLNLVAEYEKEPDDEVKTLGVEFALPIFANSSQEARLAKIKARQHKLQINMLKTKEQLSQKRLEQTLENLKIQYASMLKQIQKQKKLLELFEEGYRISKGSLMELLDVKNHLIINKRKLLNIQKETNLKQIQLNFMLGAYND
jgi:outer membrane protein TolC